MLKLWKSDIAVPDFSAIIYPLGGGDYQAEDLAGEEIDSGTDIENIISSCLGLGGATMVLPGTYAGANEIVNVPSNTTLRGISRGTVILDDMGFAIADGDHHITLRDFTLSGSPGAGLDGICVNNGQGSIVLQNIRVSLDAAAKNAFRLNLVSSKKSKGVILRDCMADSGGVNGFVMDGAGLASTISFQNCIAWKCGLATRYDAAVAGFKFPEPDDSLHDNVVLRNCLSAYSWASGYVPEGDLSQTAIQMINCTGHDNEQKETPAPGGEFEVINGNFVAGLERGESANAYAEALRWNCKAQGNIKYALLANVDDANDLFFKVDGYLTPAGIAQPIIAEKTLPFGDAQPIFVSTIYDHIIVQVKNATVDLAAGWLCDYWGGS